MITRVRYQAKPLTGLIRISKYTSAGKAAEYTLQLFHEVNGFVQLKKSNFRSPTEAIAYASMHGFQPFRWVTEGT